jgi:hypothetical protein
MRAERTSRPRRSRICRRSRIAPGRNHVAAITLALSSAFSCLSVAISHRAAASFCAKPASAKSSCDACASAAEARRAATSRADTTDTPDMGSRCPRTREVSGRTTTRPFPCRSSNVSTRPKAYRTRPFAASILDALRTLSRSHGTRAVATRRGCGGQNRRNRPLRAAFAPRSLPQSKFFRRVSIGLRPATTSTASLVADTLRGLRLRAPQSATTG